MKKFFLSLVICLMAVASMTAKTISIPTSSYCAITVTSLTRDMALTNGADVFVGENIRIQYEITNVDYYLDGDAVVEKTLAEADFTADVYTVPVPVKEIPYPTMTISSVDEETLKIKWTDSELFDTIFICVQQDVIYSPNPAEQKGWKNVTGDSVYYAMGVVPGKTYAVALELRKGKAQRTVYQVYDHHVLPSRCGLVINMKDAYGDGWNGAQLVFEEDGEYSYFTVESGKQNSAEYSSSGDVLKIYWRKGSYDYECSFSIEDVYGTVLMEYKAGECTGFSDEELLYSGTICKPKCKPTFHIVTFTDSKLKWVGEDVASYDVAILRKSNPTDEELEAAAIQIIPEEAQTDFVYEAQMDSSLAYVAFLRAKCENGYYSEWQKSLNICTYDPSKTEAELATPITLNHYEKNDLVNQAFVWGMTPAAERVFQLTEPTLVRCELRASHANIRQYVYDVANDEWLVLDNDSVLNLPAGQYVYEIRGTSVAYGEYEAFVSLADTNANMEKLPFEAIALGDTKTGSTKDMLRVGNKWNGVYAKSYRLILTDTTSVHFSCTNGKDANAGVVMYYHGSQIFGGYDEVITLPNDTFYLLVLSMNPNDSYTLKVEKNTPKQLSIIDIKPDVTKDGTIEANDWNGYGAPAKVYRYTPSSDETLMFGIDTLAGGTVYKYAIVDVAKDSLSGSYAGGTYYDNLSMSLLYVEKDVPYYFVVYGSVGTPYKLTLKREAANYDTPKITGTVEVGKKYTANYTSADPTAICYDDMAKAKFYKVHLEKDKSYFVVAESDNNVYYEVALFHPDSATGSFYGNVYNGTYSDYRRGEAQTVIPIYVDSTADYVFVASVRERKTFTPCSFSFEIDEVVEFYDAVDNAEAVNTPIIEHGTFEGKAKVWYDNTYKFFPSSEEGNYDPYNAVVYNVIVKKNRDFSVRFGGNFDAKIFVYDSEYPTSPLTQDYFKDNTIEELYVPSSYSTPHVYTVVCAFRGLLLDNPTYDLEILQDGDDEVELIVVTPVADRRSLSCNENDTWREVKNRLSKIYLFAVDSKKNYLFPIVNVEQNWEIDLDGKMAHYEVNNSDMHPGYKLANPVEWIDVALTFDNDIPFAIDEVEDGMAPIKVLRDGQLYIITQYGVFDIMGRKVK